MGFKQLRTSDISGDIIEDKDVLTVSVAGKVFDCNAEELKALKTVDNLVEVDVRDAGGQSWTLYATKAEFGKFVPDDKMETFDSARGRRTGFRPNGNGNGG